MGHGTCKKQHRPEGEERRGMGVGGASEAVPHRQVTASSQDNRDTLRNEGDESQPKEPQQGCGLVAI